MQGDIRRKDCARCKQSKSADELGYRSGTVSSSGLPYLNAYCASCRNILKKERRKSDPAAREKERQYENRPEVRRRDRIRRVVRTYGITEDEYLFIERQQDGRCACCHRKTEKLVIDHCHVKGNVAGLLCYNCNVGIGLLGDNEQGLKHALEYIRANRP